MLNLKYLSDVALHEKTKSLFKQERHLLTTIIHYLKENNRRRLYSLYKHDSLESYLMFEFGCTDDQAWRRVDVIKLLEELPEIETKIHNGWHSLTNLNLAHALFKKEKEFAEEPFTKSEKLDILETIECMPTRKAKQILLKFSSVPHEMVKERRQNLSLDSLENNDEIQAKLEKIRGLLAHSHPDLDQIGIINMLCDLGIEKWDPANKGMAKNRNQDKTTVKNTGTKRADEVEPEDSDYNDSGYSQKDKPSDAASASAAPREFAGEVAFGEVSTKISTIISKAKKYRLVWRNAHSQCENCGSSYALQIEHIVPKALGGTDELTNLKLLCRSCNQRTAIEVFGARKMADFIDL